MGAAPARCVCLVGPRGAGKSAVGGEVARRLGWRFEDLDRCVERAAGASVAQLFAREGEEGFRLREAALLAELLEGADRLVLATGGGAVLRPENRQRLREVWTVYLRAAPEVLAERVARDPRSRASRPPLATGGPLEEARRVTAERDAYYRDVAAAVVEAGAPLATVVETTLDVVRRATGEVERGPPAASA
ncbi:MAG: shikimate kinase [Planctomycetota bacterium]|nr:MAG: shikimate kinase [Planctomycetota bacterium]